MTHCNLFTLESLICYFQFSLEQANTKPHISLVTNRAQLNFPKFLPGWDWASPPALPTDAATEYQTTVLISGQRTTNISWIRLSSLLLQSSLQICTDQFASLFHFLNSSWFWLNHVKSCTKDNSLWFFSWYG